MDLGVVLGREEQGPGRAGEDGDAGGGGGGGEREEAAGGVD